MRLTLRKPLKEYLIYQRFGNKNPALYGNMGHSGMDFRAPHGTPIFASHSGFASYQVDAGGGHGVVIITDKEYEGLDGVSSFWKTIYWHMPDPLKEPNLASKFADKTGFTLVKAGELIGYADNTGRSTGDHLHFGLKPVAQGENWGTYYNMEQNNGYYGAVDPEPYINVHLPPVYTFTLFLKRGSRNEEVRQMQLLLDIKPYDGIFGKLTDAGVRKFQQEQGLVVDGLVGKNTRKALNELSTS